MSDASIDHLLDELVAPFEPWPGGWDDVLGRAHRTRRRYALIAATVAALLLVPTAVALRGRIAELFQGTPAPPAVASSFEANNRVADLATQNGFYSGFPHAEVSQAHGVLEVETGDGHEDLWVAPSDRGGQCYFVDFANDPPVRGRQYGFGGCYPTPRGLVLGVASQVWVAGPPQEWPGSSTAPAHEPLIDWGAVWVAPHPALRTLWGHVSVPADSVEVLLSDGSLSRLPVVEGFFLASLSRDVTVREIRAYDASGTEVATASPLGAHRG